MRKVAPRRRHAPCQRRIEAALAALAHDVRTPLTGILAHADLLTTADLPERERGWASAIKDAAEHLAQLTSIVLDAVKAETAGLALRKEVFAPARLAESVGAALRARAQTSGLAAEVEIGDLPAQVLGDPVRLRAALENLIDNAVKFTARGSVALAVTARPAARRRVRLNFTVTDSGIGLTSAEIRRVFRPFAQASEDVSRRYGGTGLGLALVKRLAKAMGGDLTVASKPGEGSTFRLSVLVERVRDAAADANGQPAAGRNAAEQARGLRILCVEDNPYGRVVLSTILGELGHHVQFAGSGEAALSAVAREAFDVVLMDVSLSGIDGIETTRRIRALPGPAAHVPVIGISALSAPREMARALAAGMNDYLVKPVAPRAMAEALQRVRP